MPGGGDCESTLPPDEAMLPPRFACCEDCDRAPDGGPTPSSPFVLLPPEVAAAVVAADGGGLRKALVPEDAEWGLALIRPILCELAADRGRTDCIVISCVAPILLLYCDHPWPCGRYSLCVGE